jgi:hypothetical protein
LFSFDVESAMYQVLVLSSGVDADQSQIFVAHSA